MGHMDPDLVGPPGFEAAGDPCRIGFGLGPEGLFDGVAGDGLASAALEHGHLLAIGGGSPDLGDDETGLRLRYATDKRRIDPVNIVRREEGRKSSMGCIRLGRDHDARCVLVESVNNAGPGHAANARQAARAMVQQCIDQRSRRRARRWVRRHSSGFVDDDQMGIFEQNHEAKVFGLRLCRARRRQVQPVCPGLRLFRGGLNRSAFKAQGPFANQGLKPSATDRGGVQLGMIREDPIEPFPGLFGFEPNLQNPPIDEPIDRAIGSLVEQVVIKNYQI